MTVLETNDRFDSLTNLDISTHYRDREYWFMKSSFMGAFAYWATSQSPYDAPDITEPTKAFSDYIDSKYPRLDEIPEQFTYDQLSELISDEVFESIPAIEALNHKKIEGDASKGPDHDFIDLGALSRNIFYMILRESITHSC